MVRISYAGCPGLLAAISAQFTFKMCVAALNSEKFTKNPHFGGSRSFKAIDVDTPKKLVTIVLVRISSMSVPICSAVFTLHEPIAAK